MDRTGANFLRCVGHQDPSEGNPVPLQLNIGSEENFTGVIDLVKMKAINWAMTRAYPSTTKTSRPSYGTGARNAHEPG